MLILFSMSHIFLPLFKGLFPLPWVRSVSLPLSLELYCLWPPVRTGPWATCGQNPLASLKGYLLGWGGRKEPLKTFHFIWTQLGPEPRIHSSRGWIYLHKTLQKCHVAANGPASHFMERRNDGKKLIFLPSSPPIPHICIYSMDALSWTMAKCPFSTQRLLLLYYLGY